VGGGLYIAGAGVVYGICVVLFTLSALLVGFLHRWLTPDLLERQRAARELAAAQAAARSKESLFAGFAYIRKRKIILGAISLDLFSVLFGGATALLPIFAGDILHSGPWALGMLRSAPAAGALVVAIWLARKPLQRHAGKIMFVAVALFGIATIIFGLSTWLPLSLAALALLGAADMVSVVIRSTLVQLQTPDAMRGRVSAVNGLFIGTSNQLGEFESGVTAALFGAAPAVVLGGALTLLVAGLWIRWFPMLYQVDELNRMRE
jgi:hypothetical protein